MSFFFILLYITNKMLLSPTRPLNVKTRLVSLGCFSFFLLEEFFRVFMFMLILIWLVVSNNDRRLGQVMAAGMAQIGIIGQNSFFVYLI